MHSRSSGNIFPSLFLILISPILGLLFSLKKLSWQHRKWALIVFVTIFGSILTFDEGADLSRHYERVVVLYGQMSIFDYFEGLKNILLIQPGDELPSDVYIHTVSYISGGFLGLPKSFFFIVFFIFGYFYISGISKVLTHNKYRTPSIFILGFAFLLIIHRSVDMMQSIRTWTGLWILFNGVFGYLKTKKFKYLFLMFSAPLFHLAYFAIALPAYAIAFLKIFKFRIRPALFVFVYCLSFFVTIDPSFLIGQVAGNKFGEQKVTGYYREEGFDPILEQIKRTQSDSRWYVRYGKTGSVYLGGNIIAITLIIGGFFKRRMTQLETGIFATGLLLAALANFGDFVYVFYSRCMANAVLYFLATAVLISMRGGFSKLFGFRNRLTKIMLYGSLIIFIPKIIYTLSNILIYTSVYILALPMIGWISTDLNISIREIIAFFI